MYVSFTKKYVNDDLKLRIMTGPLYIENHFKPDDLKANTYMNTIGLLFYFYKWLSIGIRL